MNKFQLIFFFTKTETFSVKKIYLILLSAKYLNFFWDLKILTHWLLENLKEVLDKWFSS